MGEEAAAAVVAWLLVALVAAFGLVIGSFLNVVIHRLPLGESVVRPRSRCPACGGAIASWHNIPVLSWLWLRGRCSQCFASISGRYPIVEALTGALFVAVAWRHGLSVATPVWMAFAALLVAAAMIDFDHQIIPDEISLGGLAFGLIAVPAVHVLEGAAPMPALRHSLIGAVLGGGMLWSVGFVHARLSVVMGRSFEHWPGPGESLPRPASLDYWTWFPGLGFGDVKLLAMIGAFLGPIGVIQTILLAALAGLALGLAWALVKRELGAPFGFAPAIALAALVVLLLPESEFPLF